MIGSIRGILLSKESGNLLIEVGGLGYEVHVPSKASYDLPHQGSELHLLTHFIARDDGQQLYGFLEAADRELFRQLIKVSGVGPKLALTILSGLDIEGFSRYVVDGDVSSLVAIPGVGKKTAERLIVEMRDKLPKQTLAKVKFDPKNGRPTTFSETVAEAEQALVSLGYRASEARKMVAMEANQDQSLGSEELIRKVLRTIGRV